MFDELFPFGGKLNEKNPLAQNTDAMGPPALDARLVVGALLLKHMTATSDEEIGKRIGATRWKEPSGVAKQVWCIEYDIG